MIVALAVAGGGGASANGLPFTTTPTAPWQRHRSPPSAPNPSRSPHLDPSQRTKPKQKSGDSLKNLTAGVRGGRTHRNTLGIASRLRALERRMKPETEREAKAGADDAEFAGSVHYLGDTGNSGGCSVEAPRLSHTNGFGHVCCGTDSKVADIIVPEKRKKDGILGLHEGIRVKQMTIKEEDADPVASSHLDNSTEFLDTALQVPERDETANSWIAKDKEVTKILLTSTAMVEFGSKGLEHELPQMQDGVMLGPAANGGIKGSGPATHTDTKELEAVHRVVDISFGRNSMETKMLPEELSDSEIRKHVRSGVNDKRANFPYWRGKEVEGTTEEENDLSLEDLSCERKSTYLLPLNLLPAANECSGRVKLVPWAAARDEQLKALLRREKKVKLVTNAEKILDVDELIRLRRKAVEVGSRNWVKAKKAGLTAEVLEEVQKMWSKEEVVAVKIVEPLKLCMDRAREIIETKTGGLVVWSKKDMLAVYRGSNYLTTLKPMHSALLTQWATGCTYTGVEDCDTKSSELLVSDPQISRTGISSADADHSVGRSLYEREVNRVLDELGPRFIDWWWRTPSPVDADLLPEVVPGYRTPFRQCPPGEKPQLKDEELTYLRRLAKTLPTHFALGKNKRLQGLASAILKLWEKSIIAKIAVKVGLLNTNNMQMALELKRLTGGTVILRNKFIIILYRGKDFLTGGVADSIVDRERQLRNHQADEEAARMELVESVEASDEPCYAGTFREYEEIQLSYMNKKDQNLNPPIEVETKRAQLEKELKEHERSLSIITKKIAKSDKVLDALKRSWNPSEQYDDLEHVTVEERQMLKKIGLRMDEHLLLGRRGIFAGVINDIHQHWKHREVVKVITRQSKSSQILYTAKLLEIESGGVLIAVEKLRSSHAIILYRGKNYRRPVKPSPENLLTKREALERSIEAQRRGSLRFFARQRQQSVMALKQRLAMLEDEIREAASEMSVK